MLLRLVTPCNGLYIRHFRNRRKLERVNVKISGTITRDREKLHVPEAITGRISAPVLSSFL